MPFQPNWLSALPNKADPVMVTKTLVSTGYRPYVVGCGNAGDERLVWSQSMECIKARLPHCWVLRVTMTNGMVVREEDAIIPVDEDDGKGCQ